MATNIHAKTSTLLPKGAASPVRLASDNAIRSSTLPFGNALARDLDNLRDLVNKHDSVLTTNAPAISELLLTNQKSGEVVAAFGDLIYQGVRYTNYMSELHVGDPFGRHDPTQATFNANTDGSTEIGKDGWFDVLDPFGGIAAWLGARKDTLVITDAVDNGAGLIRLEVVGHNLSGAGTYDVRNMQKTGVPNATGSWEIAVIDADHVDLADSVFAGAFTAPSGTGIDTWSPTIDRALAVTGVANNGSGLVRIATAVAHGYETGDQINADGLGGTPPADGEWIVSVADATHLDLEGSVFGAAYTTAAARVIRYFAGMLAQTFAIGQSFENYKLRAFADGGLQIRTGAVVELSGSTAFTSVFGSAPNTLTLQIKDALLTILGLGTEAGLGNITIDGDMDAAKFSVAGVPGVSGALTLTVGFGTFLTDLGGGTGSAVTSVSITPSNFTHGIRTT